MSTEEAPVPSRFAAPGGQGGPSAGVQVTVASGVGMPDGRTVDCPAAPLLIGWLRRASVPVSRAVLHPVTGSHGRGTDLEGWSVPAIGPDHAPRALLAAAAPPRHPELRDVVRTVVSRWAAVRGSREVLLAEPRSFCAGVERAIEVVERALESMGAPVYVRKQVVHNTHVVHELGGRGAVFVDELDEVPEGATVVFSAHGVSPAVRTQAAQRGLDVIDATCPLVTKVHVEARRFAERGDTVVFIGHAGHEETEGTLGEAPESMVLVENREDIARLEVPDPGRVSFLTQTTLAVDETEDLIAALRDRFPALRGPKSDDICYATTNRQDALRAVAGDADVVLVLGSANSSNSVRLVELAHRHGTPAHLVEDVTGIHPDWLAGTRTVGVTAGASAPPRLVDEVVTALGGLGPVTVDRRHVATETVEFSLPRKVRP